MLKFEEENIDTPTLIVDQRVCQRNIQRMVKKAVDHHVHLRPHFKTHQSAVVGGWYKAAGIRSITVSSLDMATYFSQHGWDDITVAFPLNIREMDKMNNLAAKIRLNILVESTAHIGALEKALVFPVGVFVKIDTGYHRTGIEAGDIERINQLADTLVTVDKVRFKGFLAHAGHSYQASSREEILAIHEDTRSKMVKLKSYFNDLYPNLIVSIGDTPSMSLAENFQGVDEIRPGNFIYYDLAQKGIGSCQWEDIAVVVACPIVAKHKERGEIIIYGGAVHFSKDSLKDSHGHNYFGRVVTMGVEGWGQPLPDCYVKSLSQEHGIVKISPTFWENFQVGDLMYIVPVHSCLTVDVIPAMITFEGQEIDTMKALALNRHYEDIKE